MVINEALYYGKKLDHSLINQNQLICYEMMVWDNPFGLYRDLCIKRGDGNTIDLALLIRANGQIAQYAPAYIEETSCSEWNPNTVKLGKVLMEKNDDAFELQKHVFGYHTTQTRKCSYLYNSTNEPVLHSINLALV